MSDQSEYDDLGDSLERLGREATAYFDRAAAALTTVPRDYNWILEQDDKRRDHFWAELPQDLRDESRKLAKRLVTFSGQVASAIRNAPLVSEADQRDLMTGTKTMRAALLLRKFRSWSADILHDEDRVLGVHPAGQSDDEACAPEDARQHFVEWQAKIGAILDLTAASFGFSPVGEGGGTASARIRPNTAFIMMSMDRSRPELADVADAVKQVFGQFDVRAVRADDIEHEDLITQRILNEIKTAEFCFADLSDSRPNVYYEVGYAHALGRRVILFRKAGTGLHFDLAGYNCPEYTNLRDLKEKLSRRLEHMTNRGPSGSVSPPAGTAGANIPMQPTSRAGN